LERALGDEIQGWPPQAPAAPGQRDLLPPELLNRRKSPYPKTYHLEYERILMDALREILADPNAPVKDLIDGEKTLAFIRAFKAKTPSEYGRPNL